MLIQNKFDHLFDIESPNFIKCLPSFNNNKLSDFIIKELEKYVEMNDYKASYAVKKFFEKNDLKKLDDNFYGLGCGIRITHLKVYNRNLYTKELL